MKDYWYNYIMKKQDLIKGFTLIEILVVIAIIGVLATVGSVQLNRTRELSRDIVRVDNMKALRDALHIYRNENNSFPAGTNLVIGEGTSCSGSACMQITSGSGFVATGAGSGDILFSRLPKNPAPGGSSYIYNQTNGGNSYEISFTLEGETGDLNAPDCIANQDTITCTGSF